MRWIARIPPREALLWVLAPFIAGGALATAVDPTTLGQERVSAVFLLDGQAYFGHLSDRPLGEQLELRDVYYLQDASGSATNLGVGLVHRGRELHQPADGMVLRRDKVLLIERVGSASPVMNAIATDRALQVPR